MELKYFYGNEAKHFAFYQLPKALFTDEHFRGISPEAKIIYSLLLDRMSLSVKNGWTDADGKVYIVYTVSEAMDALGCGDKKSSEFSSKMRRTAKTGNPIFGGTGHCLRQIRGVGFSLFRFGISPRIC